LGVPPAKKNQMMVTSHGFFLAAVGLSATSPRSPPLRFGLLWAFRCNPSRGNTVIGSFIIYIEI
jgi:hypothetical protein